MLGRLAVTAALVALAGCAGMEPAGRTAQRQAEVSMPAPVTPPPSRTLPPPVHTTTPAQNNVPPDANGYRPPAGYTPPPPTPQPAPVQQAQAQAQPPAPAVAAPNVAVATPPPTPPRDPNDVVVHGSVPEQQVQAPRGDPRSLAERREDIRNWDHCVMGVMAQQADPNQVETQSPEDVCASRLGQSGRNAVPQSRLQRPRL